MRVTNRNQNQGSGEVHPWAYLPSGERINMYADPTAFCIALGLQPSGQVSVGQAKLAVHQMLALTSRVNTSAAGMTIGSSFGVTDENGPPSQRSMRFTMVHIEPALRYAASTGDMSPLEGYHDIGVDANGRPAVDASMGYGVTGRTRGFGGMAEAKAELQRQDAAVQAWGHQQAVANAASGNVIEK
ncbi:hypothetical protein [Paraburkholderia azotifigens]|uniref:Uncharacterized protein n=1 Tax=Paraburkholderia azotifigens TaxID=2057004 RepID=A0A5C6VRR6_9BURK|nr:hypothetical protein [Paraburkholderia azotifigens]TXC86445.1 hypothetical protein FRZ40_01950 [Paraburkholderia azotifigens]